MAVATFGLSASPNCSHKGPKTDPQAPLCSSPHAGSLPVVSSQGAALAWAVAAGAAGTTAGFFLSSGTGVLGFAVTSTVSSASPSFSPPASASSPAPPSPCDCPSARASGARELPPDDSESAELSVPPKGTSDGKPGPQLAASAIGRANNDRI